MFDHIILILANVSLLYDVFPSYEVNPIYLIMLNVKYKTGFKGERLFSEENKKQIKNFRHFFYELHNNLDDSFKMCYLFMAFIFFIIA